MYGMPDAPAAKEPDKGHGKAQEQHDQGAAYALCLMVHDNHGPARWLTVRRRQKHRVVRGAREDRGCINQALVGEDLAHTPRERLQTAYTSARRQPHAHAQRPPARSRLEADNFAPGLPLRAVHVNLDALRHSRGPARRLSGRARRDERWRQTLRAGKYRTGAAGGRGSGSGGVDGGGGVVHTASALVAHLSAPPGPSQTRRRPRRRRGARGCRAAGATAPRCRPHRTAARARRPRAAEVP